MYRLFRAVHGLKGLCKGVPVRSLSQDIHGAKSMFQAQSHLYNHALNFISSMSLKCAVQLGIPDIIHNHERPITLPELASSLQLHPSRTACLYRLMRLLVHSGIFQETSVPLAPKDQEQRENHREITAYALTPSSSLLLSDKVTGLSPFVLAMLDPAFLMAFHSLGDWIRGQDNNTGNDKPTSTPFEAAHGMDLWQYQIRNPEFNTTFSRAMASDSQMMNLVIRDCRRIFEGLSTLVDVGGGTGMAARIITKAFPWMKCTVLDLPHVIAGLEGTENLRFVGGDMFEFIPPADAVLLKLTLHAWSDEDCVKVLRKSKQAISAESKNGKVFIIDIVISDDDDDHEEEEDEAQATTTAATKLYFDLLMMTVATGRERSKKEWAQLFSEAGFRHHRITPILGLRSLIELFP